MSKHKTAQIEAHDGTIYYITREDKHWIDLWHNKKKSENRTCIPKENFLEFLKKNNMNIYKDKYKILSDL